MKLGIYKETTARVPAKRIRALFELVAEDEAKSSWQAHINLVFTTDRHIQRLNKMYRGKNKPTDVLSFSVDSPKPADAVFGEIYIATETATRQAKALRHSPAEEFLRLACHGLMHLFGYDHQRDADAEEMEAREEAYLQQLAGR